jgi:16S rRNA C1402 N4-methylase RsmH
MGGKCIVYFFDEKNKNDQLQMWVQLSSCVASIGFFLAFVLLITIFKRYTEAMTAERIADKLTRCMNKDPTSTTNTVAEKSSLLEKDDFDF